MSYLEPKVNSVTVQSVGTLNNNKLLTEFKVVFNKPIGINSKEYLKVNNDLHKFVSSLN